MTQLVLLVAGMLRRHLCLLRPMRGLLKSMRQRYGLSGHVLSSTDKCGGAQNQSSEACCMCDMPDTAWPMCVCLCHVGDHVYEYPNVCMSISLEHLFKASSSLLPMRCGGRGWRVCLICSSPGSISGQTSIYIYICREHDGSITAIYVLPQHGIGASGLCLFPMSIRHKSVYVPMHG